MTKLTHEPEKNEKRVVVIVLDGAGAGALPDAAQYGDSGSATLLHVVEKHSPLKLDNLYSVGLDRLLKLDVPSHKLEDRARLYGRMMPLSPGKDTTSGHWELSGVVMNQPFPVYPHGFPEQIISAFEEAIGRKTLGNLAASGTEIIRDLGSEHLRTGYPIVYTSADSVFQIAAHEDVVPPEQLYEWCKKARKILTGEHAVGRVIARPFTGPVDRLTRTAGRHDYSLEPPGDTLLDLTSKAGYPVAVIGKVKDIFAHRGVTLHLPGGDNEAIGADLMRLMEQVSSGLIWATFGDFDTLFGHRNDSAGFARALEKFDLILANVLSALGQGDLLFITADHGCDPTFPTTDHTREYVPLIIWNVLLPLNRDLGIRESYADLAATAASWLHISPPSHGTPIISG